MSGRQFQIVYLNTHRVPGRKSFITYPTNLIHEIQCSCLTLQGINPETVQNIEGKCCFRALKARRKQLGAEKLDVTLRGVGATAPRHRSLVYASGWHNDNIWSGRSILFRSIICWKFIIITIIRVTIGYIPFRGGHIPERLRHTSAVIRVFTKLQNQSNIIQIGPFEIVSVESLNTMKRRGDVDWNAAAIA